MAWRVVRAAGRFDRVAWHVAPDGALGPHVLGRWEPPHDIYLTAWVVEVEFKATIRHDMLHDLLQVGGNERWHPPAFTACAMEGPSRCAA